MMTSCVRCGHLSVGTGQERLAVFALNPDSVHGQLFASVHLQAPIHQVLHLLQTRSGEERMQLIWFGKSRCLRISLWRKGSLLMTFHGNGSCVTTQSVLVKRPGQHWLLTPAVTVWQWQVQVWVPKPWRRKAYNAEEF